MADVQPFRAIHYARSRVGGLQAVAAPPYDVIDGPQRAALIERSPHNVVEIDLPLAADGGDPYDHARATYSAWLDDGVLERDDEPALWVLTQDYTGPDGAARRRHGVFARVKVEDYGPGRIRPHERTHPGPKEDRLRLTRATEANLSPIFSLYDDPSNAAWEALAPQIAEPWDEVTDDEGTVHRLHRVTDNAAIDGFRAALEPAELLIADGHHRYETARVYAQERGAPQGADHVLMCLVALQDPGLTVFPTHRLLTKLGDDAAYAKLTQAIERDWTSETVAVEDLEPPSPEPGAPVQVGFYDGRTKQAHRLTLDEQATADDALPGRPAPYRHLDTAVLEALLLRDALGMSEDDISHFNGLAYARTVPEAVAKVDAGEAGAVFVMRATPVDQVRAVAAAGENMPPKSTYFYPKVLTGMVFNPLQED